MSDLTVKDKPAVPAANNTNRPVELNQQVQNGQVPEEGDNFVAQQGTAKNQEREKGFNIFKAAWGFVKGFAKEAFTVVSFIPKFIFNLVTNPIETIKGFTQGLITLGKLLSNPQDLKNVLNKVWEEFKNADSDKKGEVVGRLLCNFVPLPIIGNPLLLNVRLLSTCRRFGVSIKAISNNMGAIANTEGLIKKLFEARTIARKANLEKDFQKALRLEGIPKELAPKLELPLMSPLAGGGYKSCEHTISINQLWFQIMPSWYLGRAIRHEVKHAGQALLAARAGKTISTGFPKDILNKACQLAPIKPGTKQYERATQIVRQFQEAEKASSDVLNLGTHLADMYAPQKQRLVQYLQERKAFLKTNPSLRKSFPKLPISDIKDILYGYISTQSKTRKNYFNNALEKEAFRVQRRYTGLMPAIPTPSIHNLPRLALLAEDTENRNPANNTTTQQENGNELDRAA